MFQNFSLKLIISIMNIKKEYFSKKKKIESILNELINLQSVWKINPNNKIWITLPVINYKIR